MKLILTGGTGFAGGVVLKQCLKDPEYEEVLLLTRKPSGVEDKKLREVLLKDFTDYSNVDLKGYDSCIWALGISQNAVKKEEYIKITHDYTLEGASAMFKSNPDLKFVFLSGQGANQAENSWTLFGNIKGRTERSLIERYKNNVVVFRPGFIQSTKESRPSRDFERFLVPVGNFLSWFSSNIAVDCDRLGRAMIKAAKNGSHNQVMENKDIIKFCQ